VGKKKPKMGCSGQEKTDPTKQYKSKTLRGGVGFACRMGCGGYECGKDTGCCNGWILEGTIHKRKKNKRGDIQEKRGV